MGNLSHEVAESLYRDFRGVVDTQLSSLDTQQRAQPHIYYSFTSKKRCDRDINMMLPAVQSTL